MISLKKQKGFTIVELLIVIVIIGILATLVIVTFTGIQQKARDSKRQTDMNALNAHLSAFFAQNGYYPSYTDLSTSSWVSANLKGFDPTALTDPKGGSIQNGAGDTTHYGYAVTQSDHATACETDHTQCQSFTITAHLEAGGTFTKSSNT